MNDTNQPPVSDQDTPPLTGRDWRAQRRAERWARREERWQRHAGRHYGWTGGAILILVGIVLLLQNMGYLLLFNWWALFILIPAFFLFVGAWDSFQENGRLTRRGAVTLTWGGLLTILALAFLFNLNLGLFWPILLIAGGVTILATTLLAV